VFSLPNNGFLPVILRFLFCQPVQRHPLLDCLKKACLPSSMQSRSKNIDKNIEIQIWYRYRTRKRQLSSSTQLSYRETVVVDNIALRSLPFFSHFVLRAGNWYLFSKSGINFPCVIQNDWKTANCAELYYPHFTTFRNETSEYYFVMLFQAVMKFLSRLV
jgi:hypothetical protein